MTRDIIEAQIGKTNLILARERSRRMINKQNDFEKEVMDSLQNSTMVEKPMKDVSEKGMALVTDEGMILPQDDELLKMMAGDRSLGVDNIGTGSLPLLKLYQAGKSDAEMPDGSSPNDGWFFYRPTQSQYKEVECYILSISRGYRAKPRNEGDKPKFTQLVSGVIDDHGKLLPFMMYVTGLKLQPLWDFGKKIDVFLSKVPMFAIKAKLTSEKVKTDYGYTHIVNYDLALSEEGFVQILSDKAQYEFLRDKVGSVEETMDSVIRNQKNEDDIEQVEVIK